MLASNPLIVSGAPSAVVDARPPKFFGTETVSMCFSAEEKELVSDSRFKGSGSLRTHRCNFVANLIKAQSRASRAVFSVALLIVP